MLLIFLLPGYIPPPPVVLNLLYCILIFSVIAALALVWCGVWLVRRDRRLGWLAVLAGVALPILGYAFVMSALK